MDLTPAQHRVLARLIGLGSPPPFQSTLAEEVRRDLESALTRAGLGPRTDPVWLGKHRLADHQRCEGLFQAGMQREGPGFAHSTRTAAGALFHRAIEIDVGTDRAFDPATVAERAASGLDQTDDSFGRYWTTLDALGRAEVVAEAGRSLALFRDSFPPLPRRWAPQPELGLKVRLAGGGVVLSGAPDLVLGRRRRLVIDFKTGEARPEHPEDMRFYALLLLLRTGVPPYRVATFFLDSGEWQAEEVGRDMVQRAARRVVEAARAAREMDKGRNAMLRAGRYCGWCPRQASCPSAWFDGAATGDSSSEGRMLPSGRLS